MNIDLLIHRIDYLSFIEFIDIDLIFLNYFPISYLIFVFISINYSMR